MPDVRRLFRLDREQRDIGKDVEAEIAAHLGMRVEELMNRGMTFDEARREAIRQFGDVDGAREAIAALDASHETRAWSTAVWTGLRQDIHYAWRRLIASPGFTTVAVLTLSLGIGGVTAIGSVVDHVLVQPLPFPDQGRLVRLWPVDPKRGASGQISVPDLDDWRQGQHDIVSLGAYWYTAGQSGADLTGQGEPERLSAAEITPGFFETLGVTPELGRLPSADELAENGPRVVVISDGLWHRRFGADPTIVGRAIDLDGAPHVVVGVMPPAMRFPGEGPELWRSVLYESQDATPWKMRGNRWLNVIGRLAPDVSVTGAQASLAQLQHHLADAYPDADYGWTSARVTPLLESIVGDMRPALLVMLAAVTCVLLMAGANIAALLLARTTARQTEFAVRAALGAPRRRLVRQLMVESMLLSLLGGLAGAIVALFALAGIQQLAAGELPRLAAQGFQWDILGLTLFASVASGILLGLPPALKVAATSPRFASSESGTRGATSGRNRVWARHVLVATEIAMAVVVVCGAALMVKSFRRLMGTEAGFRPSHALAVNFHMPGSGSPSEDARVARYYANILDRVRDIPGVIAVGATKVLPLQGEEEQWGFGIDGEPLAPPSQRPVAIANHISAGYFAAVGTSVLAGREFTRADTAGAKDVVVVNEAFARKYLPGPIADVPGRRLVLGDTTRVPIVGVVQDVHENGLDAAPQPALYRPTPQNIRSSVTLVVRTRGDPAAMTAAVERAIWSLNKDQTIASVKTLDDVVRQSVARPRLLSVLLATFSGLGLLLGALGIAGVVAYAVSERRREIGLRVALGASRPQVLFSIIGESAGLTLAGVLIGLGAALVATRAMRSVLFDIGPADPATYIEVAALLAVIALLAAYVPARRALTVDPIETLKA